MYLNWFFDYNFVTKILKCSEAIRLFQECEQNSVTGILIRKRADLSYVISFKIKKSRAI